MTENHKLPIKLRRDLEKEISLSETVQWIEQTIPRLFTRATIGICLTLLAGLSFVLFLGFGMYEQAQSTGIPLYEFPQIAGLIIFLAMGFIQLILIFLIPLLSWLNAVQTIYVITNQRAFILVGGWPRTITSFVPSELRVISRKENRDGSGDVIVYIHTSKDYDNNTNTEEMGFKQVRNAKEFENRLLQLKTN
ncbi:MAG: hypothetical protein KME14_02745 [Tildeniella torsiva UHER 1998/13D]|jgi:hypothetical protein|nr:hypothetical protein [Tildeniella torsiva UHER 1998/13D]